MSEASPKEIVEIKELTPDIEEKALFNILEDMQEDKISLEQQRIATFNILEDINATQEELRRKYAELDVIKELTQKMGMSLELKTVMENIVSAIKKLFPEITIAYVIAPLSSKEISNIIYVHSSSDIGDGYLKIIKENLLFGLEIIPELGIMGVDIKKWQAKKFYFEMTGAEKIEQVDTKPASMVNAPIVVPGAIAGLFNLSSLNPGTFDKKRLDIIYTIIASAGQTIERLKTLIASEHSRLQDLVESMSNAILMLDSNKQVVVANPEMRKIAGVSGEKASFDEFINGIYKYGKLPAGKRVTGLEEAVKRVFSENSGTIHISEMPIGRKFFEAFITPVRDWQEKTSGGAVILHDITHLKEIDRMKTEFVSIASHQLRTPLTSINWFIEMLLSGDAGKTTAKQKEFLGEVYNGSRRMVRLVNDLLNVSRIETGRLKINPKPVVFEKFIQGIVDETNPIAEESNCEISFKKPQVQLGEISIDESLMRQVVHNFITNAIRYSSAGKSKNKKCNIEIILEKKDNNIIVGVKDSGIGIPKEAQKRIFEKFFRADNARMVEAEGNGIGLYIAKMIVEASGGKIWFNTEEGHGTTFFASIPTKGMRKKQGEKGLL